MLLVIQLEILWVIKKMMMMTMMKMMKMNDSMMNDSSSSSSSHRRRRVESIATSRVPSIDRSREREREVDASTDDTTPRVALSHARIRRPHTVDDDPMGRVCVCVSIDLLTVHDSPTSHTPRPRRIDRWRVGMGRMPIRVPWPRTWSTVEYSIYTLHTYRV